MQAISPHLFITTVTLVAVYIHRGHSIHNILIHLMPVFHLVSLFSKIQRSSDLVQMKFLVTVLFGQNVECVFASTSHSHVINRFSVIVSHSFINLTYLILFRKLSGRTYI